MHEVLEHRQVGQGRRDFRFVRCRCLALRPGQKRKGHALHDFEAWLLPFWQTIQKLAQHNKTAPSGKPETVNHHNPPAYRIKEIFELGKCRDSYQKPRDARRILKDNDLLVAAKACPELKAFLNTILSLCGGEVID